MCTGFASAIVNTHNVIIWVYYYEYILYILFWKLLKVLKIIFEHNIK